MLRILKSIVILTGIIIFSGGGAASNNGTSLPGDTLNLEEAEVKDDEIIEYELIIFDPGFQMWFNRVKQPKWFYSETYLENWNKRLVVQWNQLYHPSRDHDCIPQVYIDYDDGVDYGKELNHRLFYYFRYVHERCGLFSATPGRW